MCQSNSLGPDWTDVKRAIKDVERVHSVELTVVIQPDGYTLGPTLRVSVLAAVPRLGEKAQPRSVGVWALWPCREHATMEGLVHRLVYQIDHKIGAEDYVQESFT